jgi:hypothetical protein
MLRRADNTELLCPDPALFPHREDRGHYGALGSLIPFKERLEKNKPKSQSIPKLCSTDDPALKSSSEQRIASS